MGNDKAFFDRVASMSEEAQEHFKEVIEALSECYEKESDVQAVIIIAKEGFPVVKIRTINLSEMESASKLQIALDCFTEMNMADAPPREQFN